MKILLVDDDEVAMIILETMMAQLGHDVVCCADGEEAIRCIDQQIDMVITDWKLPRLSGPELIETINSKPGIKTPVVLMSGMPERILKEKASTVGACGALAKPFTLQNLKSQIDNAMN